MRRLLMEVRPSLGRLSAAAVTTVCLLTACVASADYISDFEGLNASADGVVLTGQDGYYLPPGVESVDFWAFTYAGNALGLPRIPTADLSS